MALYIENNGELTTLQSVEVNLNMTVIQSGFTRTTFYQRRCQQGFHGTVVNDTIVCNLVGHILTHGINIPFCRTIDGVKESLHCIIVGSKYRVVATGGK